MMAADSFVTILVIMAFLVIFYGPWQWVCTEFTRQILIEERDAIFLRAAEGKISFKSEEYKTVREGFQSNIRFAHELTVPKFLMLVFVLGQGEFDREPKFFTAVDKIKDTSLRTEIKGRVMKATMAMAIMMLMKSILFWIALLPAAIVIMLVLIASRSSYDAMCAIFRKIGGAIQVESEKTAKVGT